LNQKPKHLFSKPYCITIIININFVKFKPKKMKKLLLLLAGILFSISIYSQGVTTPLQDWSSTTGSQNFFIKNVTKTFGSNIYVVGATLNGSGNYDMLVAKYSQGGALIWEQQYNGTANFHDVATAVFVDASNNVYITGEVVNDVTYHTSDVITIKYNSSGTQQWATTYNGTGNANDAGSDLTVDASGNVYVSGSSYNAAGTPNKDMIALKYNSSGAQQWVGRYDGASHLDDAATRIAINSTTVTITGAVQTGTTTYQYGVIAYAIATGVQTSATITTGGTSGIANVTDVVKDASGNIYIAGSQTITGHGLDYCVVKISAAMAIAWTVNYNGAASLDDEANGIRVDASGNVFVTGYSKTTSAGKDYVTLKYNSAGTLQWTQTYNDALNGDDEASAMAIDASGNIYVTGDAKTDALNSQNYYTIKYNTSGTQQWAIATDGDAHLDDKATDIAVDTTGLIVVTGQSALTSTTAQYLTVRYIEKSIITPADYNSEAALNSFLFYQNKGQVRETDTIPVPSVKYYTNTGYPSMYFKDNSLSMVFAKTDTLYATQDSLQRIDLTFNQVNPNAKTYALEQQASYLNYFKPWCPNGQVTNLKGNQRLIMTDLYSKIDMISYSNQNGYKGYFIVKPGGSPTAIQMIFTGATSFNLDGATNVLSINGKFGSTSFDRPTVYQLSSTGTIIPITTWTADWQTNGASNLYKFNIGAYDNSKALIIEIDHGNAAGPTATNNIKWSTYIGGSNADQINDIKSDVNKNLFIVGETYSTNFPQVTGAAPYQPTNLGSSDGFVAKFLPTGEPVWSTYIGGRYRDYITSLDFSPSGDVYCVGNTISYDMIPHTKSGASNFAFVGPNDPTYGWLQDGFIFQTTQLGNTSPWTTFYPGNSIDNFNRCKFDAIGNFFVVGSTYSSNAYCTGLTGQYNHAWNNPGISPPTIPFMSDGYIVKFDVNSLRSWSTCIGSSTTTSLPEDDELFNLDFDASGDLYVVGRSVGSNYPNISTGSGSTLSTNYGQSGTNTNGVVTRFSNTGGIKWSTYIGSTAYTNTRGVLVNSGNIYITGTTNKNDFPFITSTPYYLQAYAGSYDAYFGVFNSIDQLTHTTFLGGSGADEGWDLKADPTNTIYLAGKTTTTTFPTPAAGNPVNTYNQAASTGLQDYFICALRSDKTDLCWSTELGGTKDESSGDGYWVTVATDGNNYLHLAGQTRSDVSFPLNNGGGPPVFYQPALSSYTDGTITRFDMGPVQLMGIHENGNLGNGIFVYPNPATASINVKLENLSDKETYTVFNSLGQILLTGKISSLTTTIGLEALTSGLYFIEISDSKTKSSVKFIKNE
jgi:hypothetical protein